MAIIRGQSLMVGSAQASISSKSGIILSVEVQMAGRTFGGTDDPNNFAIANMAFYAVDGASHFPLGGDIANFIEIPFLSIYRYRNPHYQELVMVDNLGLGSIALSPSSIHKTGFFDTSLTFVSRAIDINKPHDLNVSWEIYEFN